MEPIQYNITSPFTQAVEGLKFGAGMFELEQKRAELQQQRVAQQQYQQLTAKLLSPNATASDFEAAMLFGNKDQANIIKDMLTSRGDRANKALLGQISPIAFALKTGNSQEGISHLNALAQANENAGDVEEAKYLRDLAKLAESQPEQVGNLFAGKMTMIPGGKDALEGLLKLSGEHRTGAADTAMRAVMQGVTTPEQLFEKIPQLSQLGTKGLEIAKDLLTQQRLREQALETAAAGRAKRGETLIESTRATGVLNTLIAGSTKEAPAFLVDKDGEVTENPSFWDKYAFIPTAGGPDMAVPGKIPTARPAAPVFDATKAAALGLDAATLELVKAQIELDPKAGAKLLSQIISANIKQKLAVQKPESLSAHAKMLVESGMVQGSPEFQRAMVEHVGAVTKGKAKGEGVTITNVMGEKASETLGKGFGTFAQNAMEKAQTAGDAAADVSMIVEGMRGMGGGPVAQFKAWAGQFAPAGTEWSNLNSMSELANTIQAKLAPTMREAGSGATSDMEMKSFMRAIPTIATSERGRELMAKYAKRIAERAQVRAEIVNDIEASRKLPTPAEISARMKARLGDSFFDAADRAYFGMKPVGAVTGKAETATVGGKTYTRPVGFSDAQWNAYKQAVGAK